MNPFILMYIYTSSTITSLKATRLINAAVICFPLPSTPEKDKLKPGLEVVYHYESTFFTKPGHSKVSLCFAEDWHPVR